jgi:hypothetical protein
VTERYRGRKKKYKYYRGATEKTKVHKYVLKHVWVSRGLEMGHGMDAGRRYD